ncbi:MAG TPA: alpha/beta hydrolase [Polyangiaceae bacterium]
MASPDTNWTFRSLLNPVVARLLIYGTNPFDLERVLRRVESVPIRNARQLEGIWLDEWQRLAASWELRASDAARHGRRRTALASSFQTCCCHLAQFLINPGDIDRRRRISETFSHAYRRATAFFESPCYSVQISLDERLPLSAHLHVPSSAPPHPTVAIFSGLGSCKEEMHTLARLMVARGVAALVPDMPGNGESLFVSQLTCGSANLSAACAAIADFVESRGDLDAARLGACGLCMGGGYAYRACAEDSRYRWCATLFPLFINAVDATKTPTWMKSGAWYDFQTGGKGAAAFLEEVGWQDRFSIACPFFMAHSQHDNWMPLDKARLLLEHASSPLNQLLMVEEEPAYGSGDATSHTLPVGEQLGWVGNVVADWIAERAGCVPESEGLP